MSSEESAAGREPIKLGAFGQYELGRHLRSESGGVVECFLGHQKLMDREVEVHVLRPAKEANPSLFQRFLEVMGKLARLDHPGLVRILDVDTVGARAFFTTPCRDAVRMSEHLAARGAPLPWAEVAGHARVLVGALREVHASGLLVRGISLESVFLDRERGQAYLGECPLGKDEQVVTVADGPAVGPILGQIWDERTDLFLLGSLLYELGTGKAPYAGGRGGPRPGAQAGKAASVEGLADMVAKGMAMDAVLGLRGEADEALAGGLEAALAIRPAERPSSAAELAARLAGGGAGGVPESGAGTGPIPVPAPAPAGRAGPAKGPRAVAGGPGMRVWLGCAGLALAAGAAWLAPAPPPAVRIDPERVSEAVAGTAAAPVRVPDIEALALQAKVRPTGGDAFEARWAKLQEWTAAAAGRAEGACTATDLMHLRLAHLRGEGGSGGGLDDCLRRAGESAFRNP